MRIDELIKRLESIRVEYGDDIEVLISQRDENNTLPAYFLLSVAVDEHVVGEVLSDSPLPKSWQTYSDSMGEYETLVHIYDKAVLL